MTPTRNIWIQNYNEGPEQAVLRGSPLSRAIRAGADEIVVGNSALTRLRVDETADSILDPRSRFVVQLDLIRGNIVENTKVRRYIAYKIQTILENERVTVQALKHEYRSYISECVILYERLAQLLSFFDNAYEYSSQSFDAEIHELHLFFNPLVMDIRNFNAHQRYALKSSHWEIGDLEGRIHDIQFAGGSDEGLKAEYLAKLQGAIAEQLEWIKYTEESFAKFLERFFLNLAGNVTQNGSLTIPDSLPPDISINKPFRNDFRRKLGHKKLFEQRGNTDEGAVSA